MRHINKRRIKIGVAGFILFCFGFVMIRFLGKLSHVMEMSRDPFSEEMANLLFCTGVFLFSCAFVTTISVAWIALGVSDALDAYGDYLMDVKKAVVAKMEKEGHTGILERIKEKKREIVIKEYLKDKEELEKLENDRNTEV